jgi:hypothetical protein
VLLNFRSFKATLDIYNSSIMADSTVADNMQKLNLSDNTTSQGSEADSGPASGRASLTASTDNPEFTLKHPLQNRWVWWYVSSVFHV